MTGLQALRGSPEGDDVVVAFAPRRDFDQFDRPRPPVAPGLHPRARPPLVQVVEILEIALVARALHQTETLRRVGGERRYLELGGVRELAENMLAASPR